MSTTEEMATDSVHNHLFSSLISDIKSYSGNDPLLPWLRGIKKMKESLPPNLLKEKLPRFLQKCTEAFESDRRYKNDLRYLRVWLQLMDYVDEPRAVLKTMEMNHIGMKKSLFYQAYALYYEKMRKFEEAEKMYHLGVKNLAEPADELQKSYDQFLHRMQRHKNKKIQRQEGGMGKRARSVRMAKVNNENIDSVEDRPKKAMDVTSLGVEPLRESNPIGVPTNSHKVELRSDSSMEKEDLLKIVHTDTSQQLVNREKESIPSCFNSDDTVVVKFVDTAIVGKSEAENACHHGLVDPTINMKEAMNAINSMFREPIEAAPVSRRSHRSRPQEHNFNSGLDVFIDENLDDGTESLHKKEKNISMMQHGRAQEPFQIFVDDEGSGEYGKLEQSEAQNMAEGSVSSASHLNAFVFPSPKDLPSEDSFDRDMESSPRAKFREDTVIRRFVGSTISDEPAVENVCHHGLVEPTINLKEAMDDINNMFGKPIEFARTKRPKRQDKQPVKKPDGGGFSILPDDDLEYRQAQLPPKLSIARDTDLFEPTVFTKEAIDDINKMFAMPLDF